MKLLTLVEPETSRLNPGLDLLIPTLPITYKLESVVLPETVAVPTTLMKLLIFVVPLISKV